MSTSSPLSRPGARYGDSSLPKPPSGVGGKIIAILAVLFLIAIIVAFGRFWINRDASTVSMSLVHHERINDNLMRLTVDVNRVDPQVESFCIVTAIDYSMAEVGRREFLLAPGGEQFTRVHVDIPAFQLPVSGGIYGCSTTIPSHLQVPYL